jgi:predicted dehydrogenase
MINELKVGVVGCGVGRAHIRGYQALPGRYAVIAVCDLDGYKASQVAKEYGVPRVFTDLKDLCALQELDVIDICTPPLEHYSQICQVLAAGKHVICEKPLVGSLLEIDRLKLAEQQSGKRIVPIFQYRFGKGIQKLKMLVDNGLAGRPYLSSVEVAWRRRANYYSGPWRGRWATELGGTLLNHAIHALDMLCFINGPVHSVFARTATLVNPVEVEDCASVSFEMANGSLATLSVTLGSNPEISRHRFCFSNLTAESNTDPYANSEDPWTFNGDSAEDNQRISNALAHFSPKPSGFEGLFKQFSDSLQDGGEPPVTLEDARNILQTITAMYYSAQTHQAVELPLPEDHPKYAGWLPS